MRVLYDAVIFLLSGALYLASMFHSKAKKWVDGRKGWRTRYRNSFQKKGRLLWVHAASLGEFEQGRPVIEAFREHFPDWQILLTFFSPSGYEIRKNYPHADLVCYLPADTRRNARDFLDLFRPDAAIFVKYEFWANYLYELKDRNTPTLLVSALFRPGQPFFHWYGRFWRQMLACFEHIFVQNEASGQLLHNIGFKNVTRAGDTRVDRVLQIAETAGENETVEAFLNRASDPGRQGKGLIAGSTWPADEAILMPALSKPDLGFIRWIIAPHEPSERHIQQLAGHLSLPWIRYSQFNAQPDEAAAARVLLIDNIGMLNTLYRYGWVAYIGGGFGKGIHNTLEPAAFGLPILFGPAYEKFEEARQFVARGGAFPVHSPEDVTAALLQLQDPAVYQKASEAVLAYLRENRGATRKVVQYFAKHAEWSAE